MKRFCHVTQIILQMSCDQSLVTLAFIWEKSSLTKFYKDWTRNSFNNKINNLNLALAMVLKFYTSAAKELKLKVRKFLKLISTLVETTGEKIVGFKPLTNTVPRHIETSQLICNPN